MLITASQAPSPDATLVRKASGPATAPLEPQPEDKVEVGLRRKVLNGASGAVTVATTATTMLDALPGFVYPSVLNATGAEHAQIMSTLDRLPLHHVSGIDTVEMATSIASDKAGWVILGRAHDYGLTNDIHLSRTELTTPLKMEDTLIHEVGHTVDYNHKPYPFGPGASSHHPYGGEGARVTEYAGTNPREDYAETYQEYHQRPENLKQVNPDKYADQAENNRPSFMERMVDRKEFRETGKSVGELLGPNKATRQALETVRGAAGALQMINGVQQWSSSAWTGDGLQHASGILNTASGAIMLSGVAPLASVGLQAANFALGRAVQKAELSAAEVESTVALPVRPLEALFGREGKPIQDDHRPGKVLAVATGGAIGGTAGALVGPYLGVLGGYHLAGGLGGAVGLVAGGLLGFLGGSALGGRAGAALADLAGENAKMPGAGEGKPVR